MRPRCYGCCYVAKRLGGQVRYSADAYEFARRHGCINKDSSDDEDSTTENAKSNTTDSYMTDDEMVKNDDEMVVEQEDNRMDVQGCATAQEELVEKINALNLESKSPTKTMTL